jgi:uncharacterized membrane protein YhhN
MVAAAPEHVLASKRGLKPLFCCLNNRGEEALAGLRRYVVVNGLSFEVTGRFFLLADARLPVVAGFSVFFLCAIIRSLP